MREVSFALAAFFVVLSILAFVSRRSQLRLAFATGPQSDSGRITSAPVVALTPEPELFSSVKRVGDEHWVVDLANNSIWYDTGIPVAAHFQVWIEPEDGPAADCDFIMKLKGQLYSTELLQSADAPPIRRLMRLFTWSETPLEESDWVDTIKLRLDQPCQRPNLVLNVEAGSQLGSDDPLLQLAENEDRKRRVLAGHSIAEELRKLFNDKPATE